jgi:hypothetical protein
MNTNFGNYDNRYYQKVVNFLCFPEKRYGIFPHGIIANKQLNPITPI